MKPILRFPEFKDLWSSYKIEEVFDRVGVAVNLDDTQTYREIGIRSHGKGIFYKNETTVSEIGNKRVFWVEPNCFVVNIVFAWERAVAKTTDKEKGMIASHRFPMYKPKKDMLDLDYITDYFITKRGQNVLVLASPGGAGRNKTLGQKEFAKSVIKIPSLPEQQKIADFLSTIDTIIEKQQATVSAWEERKKGVMQKLFSQEVRFKADDGSDFPDWEEKSFVNTFDSLNNSTFSRDCLNYENGSVKYIHYGDILVKYNSSVDVCDAIVPFVNEDLDCERFAILQDGDIVIADTAEDDTVGKVIEIENTSNVKTIAGLHTIACRPKEKFASKYLGYYMNSDEYHNQLRPYMQGIKVTSISKSNIALTKIMVPSLPEQQKIADCLSALDTVIQKQKETLEKWQELKKGLLQQYVCVTKQNVVE